MAVSTAWYDTQLPERSSPVLPEEVSCYSVGAHQEFVGQTAVATYNSDVDVPLVMAIIEDTPEHTPDELPCTSLTE